MPLSVIKAGRPHSVRSLSNLPGRVIIIFFNSPFLSKSGPQSQRLSDHARFTNFSPQYIQYLPLIFATIGLLLTIFVMIEADFDARSKNLPLYAFARAGPFFCQLNRSLD